MSRALTRRSPAHPHSRGENSSRAILPVYVAGSSPLTRGKPWSTGRRTRWAGLIPTHAGKTICVPLCLRRCEAHPHSRGENQVDAVHAAPPPGSSPLTRGKRGESLPEGLDDGLIPTHAGKTAIRTEGPGIHGAHPHSRGENSGATTPPQWQRGSSPLTRGKRGVRRRSVPRQGLIPTHAGKTYRPSHLMLLKRAHPHSRGENLLEGLNRVVGLGSSPLTRGKLSASRRTIRYPGLIPTHAGKTRGDPHLRDPAWAHPHSRGEN